MEPQRNAQVPYDKKTIYIPDPDIIIARHFVGRFDIDFFFFFGGKNTFN